MSTDLTQTTMDTTRAYQTLHTLYSNHGNLGVSWWKDESKVTGGQFCARLQTDVDSINRGVIIGAQHTSASGP